MEEIAGKRIPPKWLGNDMVCVVDSLAWGVTEYGDTLCLGKADAVITALNGGECSEKLEFLLERAGVDAGVRNDESTGEQIEGQGASVHSVRSAQQGLRRGGRNRVLRHAKNGTRASQAREAKRRTRGR